MLPREFPGSLDVQGQFRPGTSLDLNSFNFTGRPLLQGVDSLFDDYQGSQMPEFDFNRKPLKLTFFPCQVRHGPIRVIARSAMVDGMAVVQSLALRDQDFRNWT